ncbi:PREDICTED: NADH dehydrogenase [ubiquinone] 1 beta subcomplex subunit 2, mitochondrial [Galeopterus variegatus]|uniref:NADH dehydrogenase [ubiquinone] 1 beta subcomplex subunit 2, mitochondrial n=1 Tax=Galeopterus variegatus TaxID=482537 RepID=A0ABM0RBJ0_GALVR|nr:PREDICTED: NADH dehydrogenase [ubiquinone] 1 beta subcomplex subunit 2, mitochondrial [Galeopterus variegatus]
MMKWLGIYEHLLHAGVQQNARKQKQLTAWRGENKNSAGGGVHIEPRYRQFPQLTRSQVIRAEVYSATMWFWILWRFWHDSDLVLGHFPYPDPSQWTDEELGIPPDDED